MVIDFLLACAHHLALIALVSILAAEFALVRPGLSGPRIQQLARIDMGYGLAAMAMLAAGFGRVFFGAVDAGYYWGNHSFWGKLAVFALIGLISIIPTLQFRRWAKAGAADADYVPPAGELATSRRLVHLQMGLLLLIPIFAAAMARGFGS